MPEMTVPLYRGDELLELNVEFEVEEADPSVGLSWCPAPSSASVYSPAERAWVKVELSEREWEKVVDFLGENYEEEWER